MQLGLKSYLPADYYDGFVVMSKLPETVGKLYWKVSQVCEQGRLDWVDVPVLAQYKNLKVRRLCWEVKLPQSANTHAEHVH